MAQTYFQALISVGLAGERAFGERPGTNQMTALPHHLWDPRETAERALELAERGDVFFEVRSDLPSRALVVEVDTPSAVLELATCSLLPSLVVSPGEVAKIEAYWLFDEVVDSDIAKPFADALHARPGSGWRRRVPGTLAYADRDQEGPPVPVLLLDGDGQVYEPAAIRGWLTENKALQAQHGTARHGTDRR